MINEEGLLHPGFDQALITAGMLVHWVTSDPDLVTQFATWVEHHHGDLTPELVHGVLAAVHDQVAPGCPDPILPWDHQVIADYTAHEIAAYNVLRKRAWFTLLDHDAQRAAMTALLASWDDAGHPAPIHIFARTWEMTR